MQQLLTGKTRFTGFSDKWQVVKLGEIFVFKKGSGLSKGKITQNGKYQCILYGELYTTYNEIITNIISRTNCNEGINSVSDDIIIPTSTTTSAIDLSIASVVKKDNVLLGGDINILRKKTNNIYGEFIANYLTHIKKYEMAKYAQGITIIHLYGKSLSNLKTYLPPLPEQQKIAEVLRSADDEINLLTSALKQLNQQKKGLMQKLLTGQVRVKI